MIQIIERKFDQNLKQGRLEFISRIKTINIYLKRKMVVYRKSSIIWGS